MELEVRKALPSSFFHSLFLCLSCVQQQPYAVHEVFIRVI
jgi:hypothetical protein